VPKTNKKKLALLLGLEADQEEQSSLLMLKVDPEADPEADPGQNLLPISLSFLAFILWTLDAWTRNAPTATPYTGSMKGKIHLR
jgi:hypothetical protein